MTIKLQQNDDAIITLPLLSSFKTSSRGNQQEDYNDSSSTKGDFVIYSVRHGAAVVVSCCSEIEFLDLETQLIGTSLSTTHNLPLCEKDGVDDLGLQEEDSFDNFYIDDDSTISSYSCSSSSEGSFQKKVHFADTLVSEVWTRPRTPSEERKNLFYSYDDTQRFRYEYRLERKMQQANIDPALVSVYKNKKSVASNQEEVENDEKSRGRHMISRVVVLHNNTLETFYDDNQDTPKLNSNTSIASTVVPEELPSAEASDDFFDNDSFWSGSITWF